MAKQHDKLSRKDEQNSKRKQGSSPGMQRLYPTVNLDDPFRMKKAIGMDDPFGYEQTMWGSVQAKMEISQSGDAAEVQADKVADAVLSGNVEASQLELESSGSEIMAKGGGMTVNAPPEFEETLRRMKSGGAPLPGDKQEMLEEHLGESLDHVRLHTGDEAAALSDSINARAFAHGGDIFFSDEVSDELLAHEVTHALQQKDQLYGKLVQRAMKFEFQTGNYVWAINETGTPDPKLLPRKYAPTTVGFAEGSGEESGDKPAYLATGNRGRPAQKKGQFAEAKKGEKGMVTAEYGVDKTMPAQYVVIALVPNLFYYISSGEVPEESKIIKTVHNRANPQERDYFYGETAGEYNPGTYEFRYYDFDWYHGEIAKRPKAQWNQSTLMYDKGQLFSKIYTLKDEPQHWKIHRTPDGKFQEGHVEYMEETSPGSGTYKESFIGVNIAKDARYVVKYRVLDQDKPMLELISMIDNKDEPDKKGKYNPGTYEYQFYAKDDQVMSPETMLPLHMENGKLVPGIVKYMQKGNTGADLDKEAQFVETWKITKTSEGTLDFFGEKITLEQMPGTIDNALNKDKEHLFNYGTYEKRYYYDTDLDSDGKPLPGKLPLPVHRDPDGKFQYGHVKLMEIAKEDKEQTAVELQSESDGALEFETPKWFNKWSELRQRIADAFIMTQVINAQPTITDPAILDAIGNASITNDEGTVITPGTGAIGASGRKVKLSHTMRGYDVSRGRLVEWPEAYYSTDHLTNLKKAGRKLYVEITDEKWSARIQSSEQIELWQYASLLTQHENDFFTTEDGYVKVDFAKLTIDNAQAILDTAFDAAKAERETVLDPLTDLTTKSKLEQKLTFTEKNEKDESVKKSLDPTTVSKAAMENLLGFLQIITNYIAHGQYYYKGGNPSKDLTNLMTRTSFYSMYHNLLSEQERLLFRYIVRENMITKTLKDPLNAIIVNHKYPARRTKLGASFENGSSQVFRYGHKAGSGPTIKSWLQSIYDGTYTDPHDAKKPVNERRKTDRLSPVSGGSAAPGAHDVNTQPGAKDSNLIWVEVRYSQALGGQDQNAIDWEEYARKIFEFAALNRPRPTIKDDPTSLDTNEAENTGLIYDP